MCQVCGAGFPAVVLLEGKRCDLLGRKHCLECWPHRALARPRSAVVRPPKSIRCDACGKLFPAKQVIDGILRSLYRRRFCLECSPFGAHNTSKTPPEATTPEEVQRARRQRRLESFRRSLQKRRQKRKRDLVEAHGGRCVDSGYSLCVGALQFHHRDPSTKDFRLGAFNGSLARLIAEAEKCDLLCANCHAVRHARATKSTAARVVELRRQIKLRAMAWFGGLCQGCGGTYPPAAFQFHHRDSKDKGVRDLDGRRVPPVGEGRKGTGQMSDALLELSR